MAVTRPVASKRFVLLPMRNLRVLIDPAFVTSIEWYDSATISGRPTVEVVLTLAGGTRYQQACADATEADELVGTLRALVGA